MTGNGERLAWLAVVAAAGIGGVVMLSVGWNQPVSTGIIVVMTVGGIGFLIGSFRIIREYSRYRKETLRDRIWFAADEILHKFFTSITLVFAASAAISFTTYILDAGRRPPTLLERLTQAQRESATFFDRSGDVIASFLVDNGVEIEPLANNSFRLAGPGFDLFCIVEATNKIRCSPG